MMAAENVRYCPYCRCETWHCDGVCEWSDMHREDECGFTTAAWLMYRDKINETIKQVEDESGFTATKTAWEQRQGATARERLQDWVDKCGGGTR
jgi:hypothetical protein